MTDALRLDYTVQPSRSGNCRVCGEVFPRKRKEQVLCAKLACRSIDAKRIIEARRVHKPAITCLYPGCGVQFVPDKHRKSYCSRSCANNAHRKHPKRNVPAAEKEAKDSRFRQLDGRCHRSVKHGVICGGELRYETRNGEAIERCPSCHAEHPIQIRGKVYRKYDQDRVRLAEITAGLERSKKRPKKQQTKPGQGDAFRQASHKRLGDLRVNIPKKDAA